MTDYKGFAMALIAWHDKNARDLPWRGETDPYRIWLSEIMLQQTRAETVKAYYTRFLRAFPDVMTLSQAQEDEVIKLWEGLGYYSRARNLLKAARLVACEYDGRFPDTEAALIRLPGIGAYAAAAIASIAFGEKAPAIDGNQIRVLSRVLGWRAGEATPKTLRKDALILMPETRTGDYNQALMGLGALLCTPTSPKCEACPVAAYCDARRAGDAETLPVKRDKPIKRSERRGVALVFVKDAVLIRRRGAGLLGGMWEFPNFENAMGAEAIGLCLMEAGVNARYTRHLGFARHVFTHIVWEMEGCAFLADAAPDGFTPADDARLSQIAMPTAFRAFRDQAHEILRGARTGKEADR